MVLQLRNDADIPGSSLHLKTSWGDNNDVAHDSAGTAAGRPRSQPSPRKRRVVAATASACGHAFAQAAALPSPVSLSVTVTTALQPVTVWAWAVPPDRTCTAGVVQATTPAAAAAFLRAVRRSVAPAGRSVSVSIVPLPAAGCQRRRTRYQSNAASGQTGSARRSAPCATRGRTNAATSSRALAGATEKASTAAAATSAGEDGFSNIAHSSAAIPGNRNGSPGGRSTSTASRDRRCSTSGDQASGWCKSNGSFSTTGREWPPARVRAEILEPLDQHVEQLGLGVGLEQGCETRLDRRPDARPVGHAHVVGRRRRCDRAAATVEHEPALVAGEGGHSEVTGPGDAALHPPRR